MTSSLKCHWVKNQGAVPQKMVKFNPALSQILCTVFLSKNTLVELTKYFCVFTTRFRDDDIEFYSKEGKYKNRTKFLFLD